MEAADGSRDCVADAGKPYRAVFERLSLGRWATWKEQLLFGGERGSYDVHPDLPQVEAAVPGASDDVLFMIIAHEFGHIVDFKRGLQFSGWKKISWVSQQETRYDAAFPARRKLDFYGDGPKMGKDDALAADQQLVATDFISLYAATNSYDDFAETFAHYAIWKKNGSFVLRQPGVNVTERLKTPIFRKKTAFIDAMVNGLKPRSLARAHALPELPIRWP